ncbi:hypothetical protein [Streptomyces sp. NPDC048659]|uniref:hypothetical protein n=1 Tax=Streptomyces sp. NPDC048659 TaxID=3155489 RepID=UPI003448E154
MTTQIQPGQTYRSADHRETIRFRVTAYTPGDARAHVVDATTGKRPRQVLVNRMYTTPRTKTGQPRRSGYVLETGADQ